MKNFRRITIAGTFGAIIILWTVISTAKSVKVPERYKFTKPTAFSGKIEDGKFSQAPRNFGQMKIDEVKDTIKSDTSRIRYQFKDYDGNPQNKDINESPLFLKPPSNINSTIEFNSKSKEYDFKDKVGDKIDYRRTTSMSIDEYKNYDFDKSLYNYWRQKMRSELSEKAKEDPLAKFLNPKLNVPIEGFDKIFGTSTIDIKPRGSAELIFGVNINKTANPSLPKRLQNHVGFDFDEKIQMGVTGAIGDKMKLGINYNTEASFDFENETKLGYTGKEDEIIQNIEAGNVTLPLNGSLITGSHSLFGLKTELKFGKVHVTSVFSQQRGQSQTVELKGGAQKQEFKVDADNYEENKHFFLSHFFRENYERALKTLPVISSGVKILKIEVWITNKVNDTKENRNLISLMDLAEDSAFFYASDKVRMKGGKSEIPENQINNLYDKVRNIDGSNRNKDRIINELKNFFGSKYNQGYSLIGNAKKLEESEYKLNADLGYISINNTLSEDYELAVAYEYTFNGQTYKVGEFTTDYAAPKPIIVKMIKGTKLVPSLPTWDLMMKNVYSINAYQVNSQDFTLNLMYRNDKTGSPINYITEGKIAKQILLKVLGLDRLNSQNDPHPDGFFDFLEGITINSATGKIYFPVLEPFGKALSLAIGDPALAEQYIFPELYSKTKKEARSLAEKNKFFLSGSYQSAGGSEISLNAMNIPEGSVVVTAGGRKLNENEDYTVDYNMGRVTILNQGLLESGTPIKVSLENQSLFDLQTKVMLGTHVDYRLSDNFQLGGTIMHLYEKPLTQKVGYGEEAISNTIWGLDGSYSTEAPWLTKLVDKLPFIETKAKSTITITGEFAQLIPGHSSVLKKSGVTYLDDFEGSQATYDLKTPISWYFASTPLGQTNLFPETKDTTWRFNNYRAKIAWYTINSDLQRSGAPDGISKDEQSNHFVREVFERDLFPKKESPNNYPVTMSILNVAYYPQEKGLYNYDFKGVNGDGTLKDPASRWAGMTRRMQPTDFEESNIEYIEFWLMDPFVDDPNPTRGDMYFHLGDISEDILPDNRSAFEQGLPTNTTEKPQLDTSIWGVTPQIMPIVFAFDNDPNARKLQDVGMDGLGDDTEKILFKTYLDSLRLYFGESSEIYRKALTDPSGDNYLFYKDAAYSSNGILERYKNINGLEGNSAAAAGGEMTFYSLEPDIEDINRDNTLNTKEDYFQYKIRLAPDELKIGRNYITDIIEDKNQRKNGKTTSVKWYQFKIPISEYESRIGAIEDFRSIRFMRMIMKGFEKPVVLRFAEFYLVRGEWKKYTYDLSEGSEVVSSPQVEPSGFEISAVNIEENGSKRPVNYVLPPGVDRVIDPTNPRMRQLNEQSMSYIITDLEDGDARGAYKNVEFDMRMYKRLKLDAHAEQYKAKILKDGDIRLFIRLGSDFKQNYYEYEIPLVVTPDGSYGNESDSEREKVWPKDNVLDIELAKLVDLKLDRNDAMRQAGSTVTHLTAFSKMDGKAKMTLVGNPNMSEVRSIMIGVRNPKSGRANPGDDGFRKSGEIWINELRLTDFDEKGGWAAQTRITARLADFGALTLAGNTSRAGFGSLEKKLNERQKDDINGYDVTANFELGKFFPRKYGIKVPLFVSFAENFSNPQYNPLDPDVKFKDAIGREKSQAVKDSITNLGQSYTRRKSVNLTNISVDNPTGKEGNDRGSPKIYSISNFTFSGGINEVFHSDINTEYNRQREIISNISYNFNNNPKSISPFSRAQFLKSQAFSLIRDFNFYLLPRQLSFRNDLNRNYTEIQMRNISNPGIVLEPSFRKDFLWNRIYDLKYDLAKSIKLDYSATNTARIDEPDGRIMRGETDYKVKMDTIWQRIWDGGRTTQYHHTLNASWEVPINKLPLLGWVNVNARYTATFDWEAGPQIKDSIGNSIKNSSRPQINAQLSIQRLYEKIPFVKNLTQQFSQSGGGQKKEKEKKTVEYEIKNISLKADKPKAIAHNLKTKEVEVTVLDDKGNEVKGKVDVINQSKITFTPTEKYKSVTVKIKGKKEVTENVLLKIGKLALNTVFSLKSVSASYSENTGTFLPGYMNQTKFVGLRKYNGELAPGIPFILGYYDEKFAEKAALKNWLSNSPSLNMAYLSNKTTDMSIDANLEPLPGVRINVRGTRTLTKNTSEYWKNYDGVVEGRNRMVNGNFNISALLIKTAFWKSDKDNSKAFDNFKSFRVQVADKWRERRNSSTGREINGDRYSPDNQFFGVLGSDTIRENKIAGYPSGYSPVSQEVVIPALLAAYSGKSSPTDLDIFPIIPFPEWRVTYDGLSNIEFFKKYLKSVRFTHAYRGAYQVGNFTSNPFYRYDSEFEGMGFARDMANGYFIPKNEIASVSLTEDFNPLFNFDVQWVNSLNTKIEYRRTRNIQFAFANNQMTEMLDKQYVVGAGYRFNQVEIVINGKKFQSDLNLRTDISIHDMLTVIRKMEEGINQISAGNKTISIKFTADYVLNERFNLRFYYDQQINEPKISTTYRTSNTKVGFSLRFTLVQ